MPALGDVVAELVAKARPAPAGRAGALRECVGFGDDPGALRMFTHTPAGLAPGSPLVVVLHGCGQTAAGYAEAAGWLTLSQRCGFALLCPEQTRANNANVCFSWFEPGDVARDAGEAASIAAMVRLAIADHDLDPARVYVTGLSAGGAMACALLAAYPDLFAAGAIIAGLPFGAAANVQQAFSAMRSVPVRPAQSWGDLVRRATPDPVRRPRVAIWHGDADTTVGPAAADALVLQWTDVHGVSRAEQRPTGSPRHRHTVWRGADHEIVVEAHRIAGLGHGAPIASGGPDGCGAAAPWVLEAGVSSSLEIARSWGVAPDGEPLRTGERPAAAATAPRAPPVPSSVAEVISQALKRAGLVR